MVGDAVEMLLPGVGEPGVNASGVLRMNSGDVLPGVTCGDGWGVSTPKRFDGACCVLCILDVFGLMGLVVGG